MYAIAREDTPFYRENHEVEEQACEAIFDNVTAQIEALANRQTDPDRAKIAAVWSLIECLAANIGAQVIVIADDRHGIIS